MPTSCRIHRPTALAAVCLVVLSGCAVKRPLSDYWPDADRWRQASRDALRDPATWAPAAGAVLFAATDLDQEVAEWAMTERPLFDTLKNAGQASDDLHNATRVAMYVTALAAPGDEGHWESRWERLLAEHLTVRLVNAITRETKSVVGRTRPDGTDDLSFPSGHTSAAFAHAAFGRRNLDEIRLPSSIRRGFQIGFTVTAAGTAWARIEAGQHYPSDVMASAALANFMASLIHGAFLKRDGPPPIAIHLGRRVAVVRLTLPLSSRF